MEKKRSIGIQILGWLWIAVCVGVTVKHLFSITITFLSRGISKFDWIFYVTPLGVMWLFLTLGVCMLTVDKSKRTKIIFYILLGICFIIIVTMGVFLLLSRSQGAV